MRQTVFPAQCHERISLIGGKLKAGGLLLSTAESCTGGLVSALCTELPGSSVWFCGGVAAYDDAVKRRVLGVPEEALRRHGAVSSVVVEYMARGALAAFGTQCSIAVSGIAGPGGGSAEKPVGTVWIAAAAPKGGAPGISAERFLFAGDRGEIRLAAVMAGLDLLLELL